MKKFRDLDRKKKRNYIVLLGTVYVWLFLLSLQKAYQTISECGSCNESNRWIIITAIFGGLAIERVRAYWNLKKGQ